MPINRQIKKTENISTMEFYSAVKEEIVSFLSIMNGIGEGVKQKMLDLKYRDCICLSLRVLDLMCVYLAHMCVCDVKV